MNRRDAPQPTMTTGQHQMRSTASLPVSYDFLRILLRSSLLPQKQITFIYGPATIEDPYSESNANLNLNKIGRVSGGVLYL